MKRMFILAMALPLVFGCAKDGQTRAASGEAKKKVVFYTWWADAERTMGEALTAGFEAAYSGAEVEENYIAYSDYHSKINTMIASGSTPDVFQLNEFLVKEWGDKGIIEDQAPFYAAAGIDPDEFVLNAGYYRSGDRLWALSYADTTMLLYYNKELLAQAGIAFPPGDARNPWTWEQYRSAARKLTKDASGKTPNDAGFSYNNLVQYGTVMPTSWIYVLPLLYTGGASVADSSGTALEITSPAGLEVIQGIANLALKDQAAPTVAMTNTNAFSSLPAMLMNGQLAMFIAGSFVFPDFMNEGYDVGISQIPSFSGKGANMSLPGAHVIRKGASQEAFDFELYLVDFNHWVAAAREHGIALTQLPQTRSTYDDPALNQAWTSLFDAGMAAVARDILQNACAPSESISLKNFSEIMDQTIAPVLDKIWLGETTAQQALPPLNQVLGGKLQGVWN
jgi:multiple sugar transport system substrate-binding protein